jgi:nucleoside-diphosphate-sugar epimerase
MKHVILLTGANGFLGSACIDYFNKIDQYKVVALWNNGSENLLSNPKASIIYEKCDLLDIKKLDILFKKYSFTTVIHTAALLPDDEPNYLSRASAVNILATSYIVNKAQVYGVNNFIFCSTTSVYGHKPCNKEGWKETDEIKPDNVYSWSKSAGEEALRIACQKSKMKGLSLRISGIHGPTRTSGAVYQMFMMAKLNEEINISNSTNRFQLVFVAEIIEIINNCLSLESTYEILNIASHTLDSLEILAAEIIKICNSNSVIINKNHTTTEWIMNTDKLSQILSFHPQSLTKRLVEIYQHKFLKI